MLKLLGAAFIIAASTLGGLYIAHFYNERPKQLRLMQQALQILETEIFYGSVPLYLAMEHIGTRIPGIIGQLFSTMSKNLHDFDGESTYECWVKALQKHFSQTSLKQQDKQILLQFGQTLGATDKEDQIKHLKLTVKNLAAEENLARDEQKIYEKLSKNMGVLIGILIVILMY